MDKESVRRRIAALEALGAEDSGTSEEERKLALAKAKELREKYEIVETVPKEWATAEDLINFRDITAEDLLNFRDIVFGGYHSQNRSPQTTEMNRRTPTRYDEESMIAPEFRYDWE